MSLSWNGRIIADVKLSRLSGFRVLGAFGLRLSVEFAATTWREDEGAPPVALMLAARLQFGASQPVLLGLASPENPMPFNVTNHGSSATGMGYDITLSPAAMEALEARRNGAGVELKLRVQAEVRRDGDIRILEDDVGATFTQSDWLSVLESSGYGRSLLFEVPLPTSPSANEPWAKLLENARIHFLRGHYPTAVSVCRQVLESLSHELGQETQLRDSVDIHKKAKRGLTLDQRELVLRQAAMDYSSPSHHVDSGLPDDLYDRRNAQMLLGITASLLAAGLSRTADAEHATATVPTS